MEGTWLSRHEEEWERGCPRYVDWCRDADETLLKTISLQRGDSRSSEENELTPRITVTEVWAL